MNEADKAQAAKCKYWTFDIAKYDTTFTLLRIADDIFRKLRKQAVPINYDHAHILMFLLYELAGFKDLFVLYPLYSYNKQ